MELDEFDREALTPALALLPEKMDTSEARTLVIAICLQESRLLYRRQLGNGPARGFAQMERGGGVAGVLQHKASKEYAHAVCDACGVAPLSHAVWEKMEHDDVLGAAFARLLLWTDRERLPALNDAAGAWAYYLRNWRPGKPHRSSWNNLHAQAVTYVKSQSAPP